MKAQLTRLEIVKRNSIINKVTSLEYFLKSLKDDCIIKNISSGSIDNFLIEISKAKQNGDIYSYSWWSRAKKILQYIGDRVIDAVVETLINIIISKIPK